MNKRQKKKWLKNQDDMIASWAQGYRNRRMLDREYHEWCIRMKHKYPDGIPMEDVFDGLSD